MNWFRRQVESFMLQVKLARISNNWTSLQTEYDAKLEDSIMSNLNWRAANGNRDISARQQALFNQETLKYEKHRFVPFVSEMESAKSSMKALGVELPSIEVGSESAKPGQPEKRPLEIIPDDYKGSGFGNWLGRLLTGRLINTGFNARTNTNEESTFASFQRRTAVVLNDHADHLEHCDDLVQLASSYERERNVMEDRARRRNERERAAREEEARIRRGLANGADASLSTAELQRREGTGPSPRVQRVSTDELSQAAGITPPTTRTEPAVRPQAPQRNMDSGGLGK